MIKRTLMALFAGSALLGMVACDTPPNPRHSEYYPGGYPGKPAHQATYPAGNYEYPTGKEQRIYERNPHAPVEPVEKIRTSPNETQPFKTSTPRDVYY